jgi:hypothetical protein
MIKNILGIDFKYENDKLYRLSKKTNKWCCCNDLKSHNGYIRITINKKMYLLHRLIYKYFNEEWDITDSSYNNLIDHFDINPLNNRIENLRVVNNSINNRNKNKFKNCSSKYKGVSWNKQRNKWKVSITIDGKSKHLGLFDNEEEANECYKKVYDEIMNII